MKPDKYGVIFGTRYPALNSNGTIVPLQYCNIIEANFAIRDELEHRSDITGFTEYITLGDYAEFLLRINLFKYSDPIEQYRALLAYKSAEVYFMPHIDGPEIQDADGNSVLFKIREFNPGYLSQDEFYEVVFIRLRSKSYVDLLQSTYSIIVEQSGGADIVEQTGGSKIEPH